MPQQKRDKKVIKMVHLIVKYNNYVVAKFTTNVEHVEESMQWLAKRYQNCTITVR